VYRKLENERIEVETQEKRKRQIILFWTSMQMAKHIVSKAYSALVWKQEDKYAEFRRFVGSNKIKR